MRGTGELSVKPGSASIPASRFKVGSNKPIGTQSCNQFYRDEVDLSLCNGLGMEQRHECATDTR